MDEENSDVVDETSPVDKRSYWRTMVAYWMIGLCNNYGYVVMLTAAEDIIAKSSDSQNLKGSGSRNCIHMSTGAILLADIIPALLVTISAPFIPFFVHVRVAICVTFAAVGFAVVAFSEGELMSILGVGLTSFCSGLGEVTFLQYSSFYDKNVVSTWSSGTGAAGIVGSLSYTLLHKLGLITSLLMLLVVPICMAISFWLILPKPTGEDAQRQNKVNTMEISNPLGTLMRKIKLVPGLLKYMLPVGSVFFFEYFINQGLYALIKFENETLPISDQYHWLHVDYQVGVFLSRSSVNLFYIKHVWVISILQLANVIVFTTEAIYYWIPSFWIVLVLALWEGSLGGAAYVNTFYRISSEVNEEDKQFSLGVTTFGDNVGITLAGAFAMVAHNRICDLPLPY